MEKIKSILVEKGILNILGLMSLLFTLYFGSAGLGIILLSLVFIAAFEYYSRFFKQGIFTPYLFMLLSPLLLIHYSSITDFRIRILCFVLLAYIVTAAARPAAKKINLSLMKKNAFFVWLTAFIIFALAALVLYVQGIHLSGDEPHYLMITQSIVEDGDFDLKNNMDEKTYYNYLPVEITFHGGDYNGKYYSFHTPGVAFLLIPFYWLFGLLGGMIPPQLYFRLAAAVINAFFAIGLFTLLKKIFPTKNITPFWLFFIVVYPLIFHSIHLYPELPAATLMMYGCIFSLFNKKNYLLSGLFLSLIPWFHVKYIPPLIALTIIIIYKLTKEKGSCQNKSFLGGIGGRFFKKAPLGAISKCKELCIFFIFPVISFILLMIYTKALYGSINPANIFPSEGYFAVPILARIRTLFAYFFDQRDGLLFYAPLFFLIFFGLRRKFTHRGILLGTAAVYVLFHANTTLRGAYSPAGRPLMFVSWIFVILIVNYYYSLEQPAVAGNRVKSPYMFRLLAGLSLFVPVWLFYYPLFVYQPVFSVSTERASGLLTFFGGSYIDLPSFFPSFLSISNRDYAANYVWLGLFALVLIFHYLPAGKALFRNILKKRVAAAVPEGTGDSAPDRIGEKIISCLLFLVFAFLLCFYPHVHLIGQNKFSNKDIAFFNNSKNFYYIEGRDVFRIKAGNRYDIYFDLKRGGKDRVLFNFLNSDQVDVTVRNGNNVLFASSEHKERSATAADDVTKRYPSQKKSSQENKILTNNRLEGKFAVRLSKLRNIRIKNRLVAHIGIETGAPADKDSPFLFLKIE